jgi:hypothetical protein
MFKNEGMIIKEWINHYIEEGVEHFYLIDNGSTDDYYEKIKMYKKYFTLVKDSTRLPHPGTQTYLYNKIYLQKIKKETKWLIICDIDEYIYARNGYNKIPEVLNKLPSHIEKIWLPWKNFGSNGHQIQPSNIIQSFIKMGKNMEKKKGEGKIIVKTENLIEIGTAGHRVNLSKNDIYYNINGDKHDNFIVTHEKCAKFNLHINHYRTMSEEYYKKVKCTRGGGEFGLNYRYKPNYIKNLDKNFNQIVDTELATKKNNLHKKEIPLQLNNNNNNNNSLWYVYKEHFKKNNNIITCIKDTFIKINTEHSSLLNESQKKNVKINTIYTIKDEIKNYYIISV